MIKRVVSGTAINYLHQRRVVMLFYIAAQIKGDRHRASDRARRVVALGARSAIVADRLHTHRRPSVSRALCRGRPFAPGPPVYHGTLDRIRGDCALMGGGLKTDRRFSFKGWAIAWRLLLITLPLSILATIFIGKGILGMSIMSALPSGSQPHSHRSGSCCGYLGRRSAGRR